MADPKVNIIFTAVDATKAAISSVTGNLKSLGTVALAGLGGLAGAAGAAVAGITLLARSAEPLVGLQNGFATVTERIGQGADVMLAALQKSSGGLITNADLMRSFNKAASLVGDDFASKLPDAMGFVQRAAQATGQDMGFLFDSLVTGIGRVSPMILDNLGIQVQLAEVTDRAAEMFGKSTEELSKQEQQAALTEIVLEKLGKTYGDIPVAAQPIAQIETMFKNLRDEVGLKLLPVIQPLAAQFLGLAQQALPVLSDILDNSVIPALTTLTGLVSTFIEAIASGTDPITAFKDLFYEVGLALGVSDDEMVGVAAGLESVISWITQAAEQVTAFLEPIVQWISQNVSLQDVLIALGVAIATVIIPIIVSLITTIGPIILVFAAVTAAAALLRKAWESNFGGIQDKTKAVMEWIGPFITNAINVVKQFIGDALETIQQWWAEHGDEVIATVTQLWEGAKAAFNAAVTFIKNLVSGFLAAVKSFWDAHGKQITEIVQGLWDRIVAIFEFFKAQFTTLVQAWQAAFRGDWEGFGEKIREGTDRAWAAIKKVFSEAFENIKKGIKLLIDKMVEFFTETDWKDVGDNVVQSIAAGIRAGVKWAVDAIIALAKSMWDALVGFFKGGSPFQLMIGAGENFAQSMAMGVVKSSRIPAAAATSMAQDMSRSVSNTFNLTAQYLPQPETSLIEDVKMLKLLYGQ